MSKIARELREAAYKNGFDLSDRKIEQVLTKIDRSKCYEIKVLFDPRDVVKELILQDIVETSFAGRTSSYYSKQEKAQLLFGNGGYLRFGKIFKRVHFEYSEQTKDELRLSYPKFSLKKIVAFSKCCEENWGDEDGEKKNVIFIYVPAI